MDDDPPMTLTVVNPVTNSPAAAPVTVINSLSAVHTMPQIVWPVMTKTKTHKVIRRRKSFLTFFTTFFFLFFSLDSQCRLPVHPSHETTAHFRLQQRLWRG